MFIFLYDLWKKNIEGKSKGYRGVFLFLIAEEYIYILRWWTVYFGIDGDNGVETILLTE